MSNELISKEKVSLKMKECGVQNLDSATIRDVVRIANELQDENKIKFVRMEMGVPGLAPSQIGIDAEIVACKNHAAQFYPMLEGEKELSIQTSLLIKNFMDVDLSPNNIAPTVGSMQGAYAAFMAVTACHKGKDAVLFIDPGFPVQKTQMQVIGKPYYAFDIYDYRGERLRDKLKSFLDKGDIASIVYSNPNNPTWVCLTDEELKIIGELATEYGVIVIEDLAYFGMDFRKDYSQPGKAPFIPSVAKYTDNYILLISSSKVFNYAGQRLGLLCVSDSIANKHYNDLDTRFNASTLMYALVYKIIYTLSSGTAHTPQYAVAAIFKAVNEGKMNLLKDAHEYGKRASIAKNIFTDGGFHIVYDKDGEEKVGDGFYFTIGYTGFSGSELAQELLSYGISSITLKGCGSQKEGLRACVSQINQEDMDILKQRIENFKADHKI